MSAWGRLICSLRGHRYAGSQSAPFLHHAVPTHCERCDWTQGPFPEATR